ncbi:ABC transporter substrate-binding protein, partial [Chloroflexota bacterium]
YGAGTIMHRAQAWKDIIESIEVVDPYTLVIHQKKQTPELQIYFFYDSFYAPALSKKYIETVGYDQAGQLPIGSGPYRLVEHRRGDYLKYEAFDEHWRVVPEFKYLVIRIVPEESTAIAMLKTGEIDATQIAPSSVPEISQEKFNIAQWPGGAYGYMAFGGKVLPEDEKYVEGYHNQDPWVDVRVREAMNIAIDRDAINKALEAGTAITMPIGCYIPGIDELEPIPYDPERAKQLLTEAGYPDGFSFDFINFPRQPGAPMLPKEVEAIAGYWEAVGISPKIVPTEDLAWIPVIKKQETAGTMWAMRHTYTADFTTKLHLYGPNGPWSVWQDAEMTRLIAEVKAEMDWEKRKPIWREMAKYQRDNYITVPIFMIPQLMVSDKQKVGEWPSYWSGIYFNFEYIRHAEPLNTLRLFTP